MSSSTSTSSPPSAAAAASPANTIPISIRQQAGNGAQRLSAGRAAGLAATPGGRNFYGSTPGGTKIMYSREQLLALSTSPLSKSPAGVLAAIPAEISRSPEKSADFKGRGAATSSSSSSFGRAGAGAASADAAAVFGKKPAEHAQVPTADAAAAGRGANGSAADAEGDTKGAKAGQEEQFEMDL